MINLLKKEYPTLQLGDDEKGYTELSPEAYEEQIILWADARLAKEAAAAEAEAKAEAKQTAQAKLEALGLTVEDLTALGL